MKDHLGSMRVVMDAEGGEELGQGSEPVCTVFLDGDSLTCVNFGCKLRFFENFFPESLARKKIKAYLCTRFQG